MKNLIIVGFIAALAGLYLTNEKKEKSEIADKQQFFTGKGIDHIPGERTYHQRRDGIGRQYESCRFSQPGCSTTGWATRRGYPIRWWLSAKPFLSVSTG